MSIQIEIQGTIVNFPSSGESPLWSTAIIQFAQLVETAVTSAVGTYDVTAQTYNIDAYDVGTNVVIPNLVFDNTVVRSATLIISTYRTNTTGPVTLSETRTIDIVYNPANATNNKWEIAQVRTGASANITFNITDAGQFRFTTTTTGAGTHLGVLSFSGKALTQV